MGDKIIHCQKAKIIKGISQNMQKIPFFGRSLLWRAVKQKKQNILHC